MRQEAELATDEVNEIAPNVLRSQLPISMQGLGHVNMYILLDEKGAAVVDPGLPGEESWNALLVRLQKAGVPLKRVHTAVITHSHFDHFGAAAQLAEEAGAQIVTHAVFTTWAGDIECSDPTHDHGNPEEQREKVWTATSPWGTPRQLQINNEFDQFRSRRGPRPAFTPHPTKRVRQGDVLRLAGRDWFVHHTPGHTYDHVCFHDPEGGVLLTGDHVLPTITPHIEGDLHGDPLEEFMGSLEAIGRLEDVSICLPAHGHPFEDLPGRVKSIREHHIERLETIREIARGLGGWGTVVEFSHHLFRERSWGSLAESETWGHLEHLRLTGHAEQRRRSDGLVEYRVATGDEAGVGR